MSVVVRDIHGMKHNKEIIGYCVCGREVKYTPTHIDRECPLCGAELTWNITEERGDRE